MKQYKIIRQRPDQNFPCGIEGCGQRGEYLLVEIKDSIDVQIGEHGILFCQKCLNEKCMKVGKQ